jgi:hypothetical protein
MKISYRTNPALGLITGDCNDIYIHADAPKERIIKGLNYIFNTRKNELLKDVTYASQSFVEAAMKCYSKMISSELYKELEEVQCGVLLFGNSTFIYDAQRTIINGHGAWMFDIIEFWSKTGLKTICWNGVINYNIKVDESDTEDPIESAKRSWDFIRMILMFKKFAQVETKYLPAGRKINDINCKYVNETKQNITYLTSTWFTNLVKSDAFKVRGHFRLQPYGEGLKDRKLIWINEFEKEGYTAPARKLSNY